LSRGARAPYARAVSLTPVRLETERVYVERRGFSCAPSCGCCLLALLALLLACALLAWLAAAALGLR